MPPNTGASFAPSTVTVITPVSVAPASSATVTVNVSVTVSPASNMFAVEFNVYVHIPELLPILMSP